MLIKFIAKNFLSFHEETEFNMLTGDIRRLPHHVHNFPKVDLLKSAVIYGANGAGKSNLVNSIFDLKYTVMEGTMDFLTKDCRFRLADVNDEPSKLEVEFMVKGIGYAYGIVFKDGWIVEEWLFVLNYGKKADELIFERKVTENSQTIKMSPKYTKSQKDKVLIQIYEEDLLEFDVPFLYLVRDKKFAEITEAYKWFNEGTLFIFPNDKYAGLVLNFLNDPDFKVFANDLVKTLATGIEEIELQTLDFDQFFGEDNLIEKDRVLKLVKAGHVERVGDNWNAIAMLENDKPVIKKGLTYHQMENGKKVKFELFEESDGTLRLTDFIPMLYVLRDQPVTIFVDEIDQSIHPALLKEFIAVVQQMENRKGQLIFTTHESNLLDLDLFRQDEIWFAEKSKGGATHFYPLSDYDVRPDLDIRKGYLSGRFGAIPFLGNLKDLNWAAHGKE